MICPNCDKKTFLAPIVCKRCGYDFLSMTAPGQEPGEGCVPTTCDERAGSLKTHSGRHSGVGIAATLIAGFNWLLTAYWLYGLFVLERSNPDVFQQKIAMAFSFLFVTTLIALFLAVDGIMDPERRKLFPLLAMILLGPYLIAGFAFEFIGIAFLFIKGQGAPAVGALGRICLLLTVIGTSLWVLTDARKLGVRKGKGNFFADFSPRGWYWGCVLLWILIFPSYLLMRVKYKRAACEMKGTVQERGFSEPESIT